MSDLDNTSRNGAAPRSFSAHGRHLAKHAAAISMWLCAGLQASWASETFVRVNQIGYPLASVKIAIAMSRGDAPATFQVLDAGSKKVVFEGAANALNEAWGEFPRHAELDFTGLTREGRYVIRSGAAESPPFIVADNAYIDLPDQLLDFMRQQRCGFNPFVNAECHQADGRSVDGPLPPGARVDARGGWHDAGDQLKYLLTSSNATAQMLLAYQLGDKRRFADRYDDRGRAKANGIADLLDEARWGLDWMLRLHPAADQLYHQVADDRDHTLGFRSPQDETTDYGWGPGGARPVYAADGKPQGLMQYKSDSTGIANLAGRYAAAMALGFQAWKDDPQLKPYAQQLLKAGRDVYALGKAREGVQQGNSYKAPYRYAETSWADDMQWGAAELFRATNDSQYRDDALHYAELANSEGWFNQDKIGHYQYYPFMNLGHFRLYDLVEAAQRKKLIGYYREQLDHCAQRAQQVPYRVGTPFIWCSNNLAVALATEAELYERMSGDQRFRKLAAAERDWLLGRNPWGYSMFTEIPRGGTFPRDVHLFGNAVLKRSIRGGLVDGPVTGAVFSNLKGVHIRQPDPLAAFQDARAVFHDDIGDYSTNEPTMDGTASAILMWVLMAPD